MSAGGEPLEALVEVPRGSPFKWAWEGRWKLEYVSPLPCPFNYGQLPGRPGRDGDPADAVVLGRRLPRGSRVRLPLVAAVRFLDAGQEDTKWVLGDHEPGPAERLALRLFFQLYAHARALLNLLEGKRGPTRYLGLELSGLEPPPVSSPPAL